MTAVLTYYGKIRKALWLSLLGAVLTLVMTTPSDWSELWEARAALRPVAIVISVWWVSQGVER